MPRDTPKHSPIPIPAFRAQYVGKSDAPKNHHDDPDEDSDGYIFQRP